MEKSLYELPQGLEAIAANQEPLEIEIEDPEAVTIGIGGETLFEIVKEEEEDEQKYFKSKRPVSYY